MGISSVIKTIFIRIFALFCFSKRSKVIFYHDIHDDIKYVDFSTPIELFRTHIKTIESNGYEIVSKIKNPIATSVSTQSSLLLSSEVLMFAIVNDSLDVWLYI